MSDWLGKRLASNASVRRLAWRVGRRLYTSARGEQVKLDIETDGELYLMKQVIAQASAEAKLVAFDVGANEGEWSRAFFDALPGGRRTTSAVQIEAFEPVPTTRARLEATLAPLVTAGLARIHPVAMSDVAGRFDMAIMSATGGTNSLHFEGGAQQPPGGWASVETQTLDVFCSALGVSHIHLLKCDTEGHDSKVIAGARGMLSRGAVDVCQFEYNHRWVFSRSMLKDVFDLIAGTQYALGRLTPDGVEVFESWHMELERFFQSNYVLLSKRAQGWIKLRRGVFDGSNTYA